MISPILRAVVGFGALALACFIGDSVLRVTEEATALILPVEALEEMAAEDSPAGSAESPDESSEKTGSASSEVASNEATEKMKRDAAEPTANKPVVKAAAKEVAKEADRVAARTSEKGSEQTVPPDARQSESSTSSPPPSPSSAAPIPDPIPDPARDERVAAKSEGTSEESASDEARLASAEVANNRMGVAPLFNTSDAGQLASFDGEGVGVESGTGPVGSGHQPVWDVRLAGGTLTSRDVQLPTGFVLVAVRLRGQAAEIVPLGSNLPVAPLSQEEFVKQYPAHASRQGIKLAYTTLNPWREKLLNFDTKGGWQAWLLIDNSTHADWLSRLRDEVRRQGKSWSELAKVSSSVELRRRNGLPGGTMTIIELTWKK